MENQETANSKSAEIEKTLDEFLRKLTVMGKDGEGSVLKQVNRELEIFLEAHSDGSEDGFLESLKQCNRSGAWYNAEYLRRIIHHFQRKWGITTTFYQL